LGLFGLIKIFSVLNIGVTANYINECFPTIYRGLASTIIWTVGRTGSTISPIVINFLVQNKINPLFSFGILAFNGIIITGFLKETFG